MKIKFISLKQYLDVNKKFFVFLTSILLIAIIAGSVFSLILNDTDASLVSEFLSKYLENISTGKLTYKDTIISILTENLALTSLILILSYSVVGVPFIILMFFYKSFIIGFSISSILINYRIKGILFSILYVFPHHVIGLILLIFFIIKGTNISYKIIQLLFLKGIKKPNNFNFLKSYLFVSFFLILISIYEITFLPYILKIVLNIK